LDNLGNDENQQKDDGAKKQNQRDPVVPGHGRGLLARLFRQAAFDAIRLAAPRLHSTPRGAGQAQQSEEAIAELYAAEDQFEDFHGSLPAIAFPFVHRFSFPRSAWERTAAATRSPRAAWPRSISTQYHSQDIEHTGH